MNRIVFIGNNNNGKEVFDGGRLKTRLYYELSKKEGYESEIVDIYRWYLHFPRIIRKIKNAINNNERIIIMAGPKGCRFFIPLVNFLNKKKRTHVVFCPLGIGTLDKVVKGMTTSQVDDFIACRNFNRKKDGRFKKELHLLKLVIVENNILKKCYETFYELNNVEVLENFRNIEQICCAKESVNLPLHICFYSRVTEGKGVIDLMQAIKTLNNSFERYILDIYGEFQITNKELFDSLLDNSIRYLGCCDPKNSISTLSKYDLFCLPTKYHGEGTPGSLVEALIAGVPVLVSSYNQVKELITDDYNGYIFEIDSIESLKYKLSIIYNNKNDLLNKHINALNSGKKFLYSNNRMTFLKLICGVDE